MKFKFGVLTDTIDYPERGHMTFLITLGNNQ